MTNPTDTEMLDWLEAHNSVSLIYLRCWTVHSDRQVRGEAWTLRDAIADVMRKEAMKNPASPSTACRLNG